MSVNTVIRRQVVETTNANGNMFRMKSRRPLHVGNGANGSPAALGSSGISNDDDDDDQGSFTQLRSRPDSVAQDQPTEQPASRVKSIVTLLVIFSAAVTILYMTYRAFPQLDEEEKQHVKLPLNIEDAKQLGLVLTKYRHDHYPQVLLAVCSTYIFLQTFAIPGSIFLTILAGYLFPFYTALILVCTCSTVGASFCYGMVTLVGRRIVMRYWPDKVRSWCKQVDHHREHLINYVIFLRITPLLPNWFINIASPVINVDLVPFAVGTFIGVAPPSFFLIQTGTTLYQMTESTSDFTWGRALLLAVLALLSLLPVFFKKKLRTRLE